MESLMKYIPFIDFILKIDKEKYTKFVNIKQWIISRKKKYSISAINKIEKSITTQYKNLLLETGVKIPDAINDIFAPMKLREFVNLCSDDEENETQVKNKSSSTESSRSLNERKTLVSHKKAHIDSDDDDLEFVSVVYVEQNQPTKQTEDLSKKDAVTTNSTDMDEIAVDLFSRIDKIFEDDLKLKAIVHEPNNYTYQQKDVKEEYINEKNIKSTEQNNIFQRRIAAKEDCLFKRREDFKDIEGKVENNNDEVEVKNFDKSCAKQSKLFGKAPVDIISLDSDSDTDGAGIADDDNRPSTSKAAALKAENKKSNTVETLKETFTSKDNCNTPEEISDSVLSMNNIVDLVDETRLPLSPALIDNDPSENNTNKENTLLFKDKQTPETNQVENLIMKNIDLDVNTLCKALEFIHNKSDKNSSPNSCQPTTSRSIAESPPPAPPPIKNNLTPPHVQSLLQQHQQQQNVSVINSFNPSNVRYPIQQPTQQLTSNYTHNVNRNIPAPMPKLNDPRIVKQFEQIRRSHLMTYNILNPETSASIMKICESQQFQQAQSQQNPHNKNIYPATKPLNSSNTNSSKTITYGEYKRRKLEKQMEEERQKEEHKNKAQLEKEKLIKNAEYETRCQLLSTLNPCIDQLAKLWRNTKISSKNSNENNKKSKEEEEYRTCPTKTPTEKVNNEIHKSKENQNNEPALSKTKKSNNKKNQDPIQKTNRLLNELKCTVKGYDQLHDYFPIVNKDLLEKSNENGEKTTNTNLSVRKGSSESTPRPIGLRRRSSIRALSAFPKQLSETSTFEDSLEKSTENSTNVNEPSTNIHRPIGLRRRSSIHANSAIAKQLAESDLSDCENNIRQTKYLKRSFHDTNSNSSCESQSEDTASRPSKLRKSIDEIIKPTKRVNTLRILDYDDDTVMSSSSLANSSTPIYSEKIQKQIANLGSRKAIVRIPRLSLNTIRKHTKKSNETDSQHDILMKKCEKIAPKTSESATKTSKKLRCNNDCQMTERNTRFCVLCNSKPSNLTNHFIGKHKTESYVSRLDWSELDDLIINTPIAKVHLKTKNCRFNRHEVICPFCKDSILDVFMNLYQHYSTHTGEYAFQCAHCHLTKPYRPDIQSHILHSKTCRSSSTKVLYRYSPNAQCIYLHYCTICNFVQINEANVWKHLREHHNGRDNVPSNVGKCILVAMSDDPDVNETNNPTTRTSSPVTLPTPIVEEVKHVENIEKNNKKIQQNYIELPEDVKPTELNFKVNDDDIPVGNEPCLDDEFMNECSIEKHLKLLHTSPLSTRNAVQPPMTVIHCNKEQLENSPVPVPVERLHKPILIKNETTDLEETPIRSSQGISNIFYSQSALPPVARNQFTIYEKYRSYPQKVNYMGLYKCMIDDCYYSTDCSEELCQHLNKHLSEENLKPNEYLQCPYCILAAEIFMDPARLVEHIRSEHGHLFYQCSMCCYRSCDASNVNIHQQMHHNNSLDVCKIYKCNDNPQNTRIEVEINELIHRNVMQICCQLCNTQFYHSQLLVSHMNNVHKLRLDVNVLKIYSCIYCPLTIVDKNVLRNHVATKHPDEIPLIYDHNTPCNRISKDVKSSLNIIELSEYVEYVDLKQTIGDSANQENLVDTTMDIKPNINELLQMNEDTIRIRLLKLTAHTGISPDNLYRCPQQTCGGFFSTFDLWLRHMKVRHHCIECQCPHCPSSSAEYTLEQFKLHFEQHRRHTFICYHCPSTYVSETLANQHAAQEHSNMGLMHFEQIRVNLSYSYFIMLQCDLYKERENFIAELLTILDKRLKDFNANAIQKLKYQWPVVDNALWVDDYLPYLQRLKVSRGCLMRDCGFRTTNSDYLLEHLRTMHSLQGMSFSCVLCDFRIVNCEKTEDIINHIKIHNENICICTACATFTTPNRSKMSLHIEELHSARDVPIIQLFKNNHQLFIEIYIVFANNCLTFSTMKNCFCCPEKNMSGDVFLLHLRRYHKLSLQYFCENVKCNLQFKSLNEVKSHFQQLHSTEKLKIRCKLGAYHDLCLASLNNFQLKILNQTPKQQLLTTSTIQIKKEPTDVGNDDDTDNVILLEDDDIVVQNSLKDKNLQAKHIPKIKCASINSLIQLPNSYNPPTTLSTSTSPIVTANCIQQNNNIVIIRPITSVVPTASFQGTNGYTVPYTASADAFAANGNNVLRANSHNILNNSNSGNTIPANTIVHNNNNSNSSSNVLRQIYYTNNMHQFAAIPAPAVNNKLPSNINQQNYNNNN